MVGLTYKTRSQVEVWTLMRLLILHMVTDYFSKFERFWHSDYVQTLDCGSFVASFVELIGERWALLSVSYPNGRCYVYAVLLKPDRWMTMRKESASLPTDNFTGYTYNSEGPFGWRLDNVEAAREKVYTLSGWLRPVAAPAPMPIVEAVVAPIPKKVRDRSYYRHRLKRERLRRLAKSSGEAAS